MAESDEPIAALVVLPTRSGRAIDGASVITVETLPDFEFDPRAAAEVANSFAVAGFTVGVPAGISLSIAGPRSLFEKHFGTVLALGSDGGWQARGEDGTLAAELPTTNLASAVSDRIVTVTFEPPMEFLSSDI